MVGKREVHGDRRRCLAGRLVLAQNAPELRFKGPESAQTRRYSGDQRMGRIAPKPDLAREAKQ